MPPGHPPCVPVDSHSERFLVMAGYHHGTTSNPDAILMMLPVLLFFSWYLNTGSDCPPRVSGSLARLSFSLRAMTKPISLSSTLLVSDSQMAFGYLKIKM